MANEEIKAKTMTEDELDNVVGGAGYAYFMKRKDGKYDIVSATDKLTPEQVKGILAGKAPAQLGIAKSISTKFHVGIQADKLPAIKQRLNKFYNGCTFQDL